MEFSGTGRAFRDRLRRAAMVDRDGDDDKAARFLAGLAMRKLA
jgi:hypothetical protein